MRFLSRSAALALSCALLAMPARSALATPVDSDDGAPCQVWCDALQALCQLFGGGYLCKDMQEGCYFGCKLKVT